MRTRAVKRRQTSLRLNDKLFNRLKKDAARNNSSFNKFVENILLDSYEWKPNAETLRAMEEVENDHGQLDVLDMKHFYEYVEAL